MIEITTASAAVSCREPTIHTGSPTTARTLRKAGNLVARALAPVLFATVAFQGQAHADQIQTDSSAFYGNTATTYSFSVSGAGTLSANLTDQDWMAPIEDLMLQITTPDNQVLSRLMGAGLDTVSLASPGMYNAIVTGKGAGSLTVGAYGLTLDFQAADAPAPVPLPGSVSLLLGGATSMLWFARRKGRTNRGLELSGALG